MARDERKDAGKKRRSRTAAISKRVGAAKRRPTRAAKRKTRITSLAKQLQEALQQQTATAEILRVITRSELNLDAVLSKLVASAARLCNAERGLIFLRDGNHYRMAANFGFSPELEAFARANPLPEDGASTTARAGASGEPVQAVDLIADKTQGELAREYQRLGGHRTNLGVPLRRDGITIGVFTLTRQVVRPFTERQVSLVQTFADQAVIAIQNVRLFDEVQARTRDLSAALMYQTGSANILKVIASSVIDVAPVLQAIAKSACELCEAADASVFLKDGNYLTFSGHHGPLRIPDDRMPINRGWVAGRAFLDQMPVHVDDFRSDDTEFPEGRQLAEKFGHRTTLGVPLLRENESIGAIVVRRMEVRPFTVEQIELIRTFADQAVIAIENARLFNETQEALERQTATADVLKVIASSPTDLKPVFTAIAERSNRLIGGHSTAVFRFVDQLVHLMASTSVSVEADAVLKASFPRSIEHFQNFKRAQTGEVIQTPDFELEHINLDARNIARARGFRSALLVPLNSDTGPIGLISVTRKEAGQFAPNDVQLLQTFADQAVIAISNVNLFEEVQAKTRDLQESLQQQTATADVLKVISRSAFDLQPVLDTLLQSAVRLADADKGTITRQRNNQFYREITYGFPPEFAEYARTSPVKPDHATASGRALLEGQVIHIEDAQADPHYAWEGSAKLGDFRTVLGVPLLREGVPIGVIGLSRSDARPFTKKQIELVTTFADQAVIAIENVRLFDEVQTRTKELAASLDELRTAQDRLVQTEKLASLGQLTAGIAHEIKNPLNFVNNFSALSAELIDEMKEVLSDTNLENNKREELDEITQMLKSNLEKVIQHGKRADSIVKNMLLHSRQGSGEHRPVDINALVDESLNLAYHGARAEKTGFNIDFKRYFDPAVGMADVYPQEITRVLLNLISNGFYATAKRKTETGDGFEPTLTAATKNLGNTVEIRIRDNGTGIPAEVKEKIFNPFFTTKPAGEGTGLGLSMSYDIIVKQHGGTIDVDTEPGSFTEFRIVLPRAGASVTRPGEGA